MSNQIDNLVQKTQDLQARVIQSRPRSTSPLACRDSPAKTNFRQSLFNSIFVENCKRAFTADGVMQNNFDYYVTRMPTEVHTIIGEYI